ncbi:hypothetical protein OOJ91_17925 [Micromonospora lupini]|uniref:hypothetical protein n=1 Tax=Micromonospora lupini TaxID=285679 RepID=UPI002254D99A|nr:hypothetical protein [Micromonospora lupini]MCX5067721.1 hypothetical protein [Micromonospora lupini]
MSEHESIALAERFARYRAESLTEVESPGPAAVRVAVRKRRRRTFGAAVAAVLAVAAGPVLGYATLDRPQPQPGPVEPTGTPSASPSATVPASASASPSTTASGGASPTRAAPDGRISRSQLLAATVSLPAWTTPADCPTGRVRLGAEPARDDVNELVALDHGDLDGDGATETVALVRCVFGTRGPFQVVAFDRDPAGRVVTLGRVTGTARPTPGWVTALDVRDDGEVRVEVADIAPGGGWPLKNSQRQWRGYRWTGDEFDQVSGPSTFGPNPRSTDLSVTATDLVLTPAADGSRSGTVTVRIRNDADRTAPEALLTMELPKALRPIGDGWSGCDIQTGSTVQVSCRLSAVRGHDEVRRTLELRVAAGTSLASGQVALRVWPADPDGDPWLDNDSGDNESTFDYR